MSILKKNYNNACTALYFTLGKISRVLASTAIGTTILGTAAAAADGVNEAATAVQNGINSGMSQIFSVIKAITLPVAAIVVVICGVKMLWGNQKSAEEAKSTLVRVIIAVAIIYIGPLLAQMITEWFKNVNADGVFGSAG